MIASHSDVTITFQAVFQVDHEKGLTLTEVADGVSVDDVKAATGCLFEVAIIIPSMPHPLGLTP